MKTRSYCEYLLRTTTAVLVLAGAVGCTTSSEKRKAAEEPLHGHTTFEHDTVTELTPDSLTCINALIHLYEAKHLWALENRKAWKETPTDADLFGPRHYMAKKPVCPSGGTYTLGAVQENPSCSIPGHTYPY